jgi:hypothetical protein
MFKNNVSENLSGMLSHMLLSLSARHAQFAGLPQGLSRHAGPSLPPGDQDYSGMLLVLSTLLRMRHIL